MDVFVDLGQLLVSLPELQEMARATAARYQAPGVKARAAGLPITADPWSAGTWPSARWLEGWSGTKAPERTITLGKGFNMTPSEEYLGRMNWMAAIGVPQERIREAMKAFRTCYAPEDLPPVQ